MTNFAIKAIHYQEEEVNDVYDTKSLTKTHWDD
jgi:hypothetical protein